MRLERPSLKWKEEHIAYMNEWDESRMTPSSFQLEEGSSYESYLEELAKREEGQGKWLPCTNYFLVDDMDRIVGMIDIRHDLNEYLHQVGGHIGYGVRPSERRKGYATWMLSEALKVTDTLGINPVLITCNHDNMGSAKTIQNNGGQEDESFTEDDGTVVRRFWIHR
ncbi:GNAT family N-acetyltransferase [Sporosarcina gallistercoris]|uniref:GNAT family N-acetyltransferase n=1 Tax=Sporosarcina gallistercoris TaxID=2762245 RepID=A0ABR8PKH5_9BACL|nr:GNAT family N-acetyltransferase [Sporosarcina gallistercoris]MBD7908574.1 GNAT family N-acetyltransferase [Sporosarcina gallistercoris]